MRVQFVQNLHKLQMTEKHINTSFILCLRILNGYLKKLSKFL